MYEFWYEYSKPNFGEKVRLCYMNKDIIYIKTDDIYKDIGEDVETRFDISDYQLSRPFHKGKIKK